MAGTGQRGILKKGVLRFDPFRCECADCGAVYTLELERGERGPFACPLECGAVYMAWHHPMDKSNVFRLMCVVRPVYGPGEMQ